MKNTAYKVLLINTIIFVSLFAACKREKAEQLLIQLPHSSPEKQGVATEKILQFIDALNGEGLEIHSFVLLRHGKVITDAYWHPYRPDINHIMHSASKTFTATAIGFAVTEKLLTIEDKVISFFPDDLPSELSPYLKELSIKHLLKMSAGHETAPAFDLIEDNWIKRFLATPIVNEPGSVFSYSSYASYMLSAIIQKVSGVSTSEYLTPRLFAPLGMDSVQWETDAQGISCGGWGLRVKTSDMAKLGQFYLQEGVWNNKQLLPASWIKEARSAQIYQVQNPTEEQKLNDEGVQGYGYQIWRCTHNAYRADGADGQFIIIMPDQDAVLAVTSRVENMHRILELTWEHLLTGMFDQPLRSNADMGEFLVSKLSSLNIPNPFFTDEDRITPLKDINKVFSFEPNESQIEQISFNFDEIADCKLTIKIADIAYNYHFGLDRWRYGSTDRPGPYFLSPRKNPNGLAPFTVSGYCSWTAQDELRLRLLYITENHHETFVCTFKNEQIVLRINNTMQPNDPAIVLSGKLIK